jgi:uncharacterized protein
MTMEVYMRVRETIDHYMVAMCDKALLNKTLIKGDLEFKVSEEFYGHKLVHIEECLKHLEKATIANMVGKTTVDAAIEAGMVHKDAVVDIQGHPHAQWVEL